MLRCAVVVINLSKCLNDLNYFKSMLLEISELHEAHTGAVIILLFCDVKRVTSNEKYLIVKHNFIGQTTAH